MIINDKMVVGVLKQILTAIFFKYLVNPFIPPYLFGIFPFGYNQSKYICGVSK